MSIGMKIDSTNQTCGVVAVLLFSHLVCCLSRFWFTKQRIIDVFCSLTDTKHPPLAGRYSIGQCSAIGCSSVVDLKNSSSLVQRWTSFAVESSPWDFSEPPCRWWRQHREKNYSTYKAKYKYCDHKQLEEQPSSKCCDFLGHKGSHIPYEKNIFKMKKSNGKQKQCHWPRANLDSPCPNHDSGNE